MAKNQNITDQQELNRLTREYETMLNRVNSLRSRIGQNPIRVLAPEETGNIRNLTSAIKTLADESSALNEQLSEAKKSFVGLNDEIKEFGKHLEEQNKGIEDLIDSFKTVTQEVKTLTKDLAEIKVPSLTQRIGFEIDSLPEIKLPDIQLPTLGDKVLNIVVKGVEEAEDIFKKLAEPFSKTISVGAEVTRTAQAVQPPPPIQQSVEVRIDDSYINPIAASLGKTAEEVKRAFAEASVGSRNLLSSVIDIQGAYNAIRGSLEEVGNATDKALNRSLKSMRAIDKISGALALDAEGTYKLNLKELQQKQKDFDLARETLKLEENKLKVVAESITASEAEKAKAREALDFINDEVKALDDIGRYNAARINQENEINQLMGAGGALIKGATTLMTKLGISTQAFGDGLERAEERMREVAKEIQSGARSGGRLTVLMSGLGGLASALGTALTDPLTVITAILGGFLDVNKAAVELQRLTGTNESAAAGVNSRLITSVEYLRTAAELTKEIGLAANAIFDSTQLAALSEAQKLLGLSAEQTANLGLRAQLVGDTVDGFQDSILAGADAANRMGRSAVAPGIVLQDVLNTSEDISLSLGQNPKALGKAAVSARAFGLSLEQVNNIADGLLDFESSIGAELEAQLLTGRNIQLSRARELALVNDLEGLSKELANQGIRAADFANMNRIQQESVAKALGMSRDQLAKSLVAQAAQGELTDDQRTKVLGVTREQLAQLDVQQKLKDSLSKLAQAFAPMLDILIPFVELVGRVLTPIAQFVGWIMQGAKALGEMIPSFGKVGESASWVEKTLASISGILKSIPSLLAGAGLLSLGNMFKNLFSGKGVKFDLFKKVKEKIGKSGNIGKDAQGRFRDAKERFAKAPIGADKVSEVSDKAADSAKKGSMVPQKAGQGIKEFLTNLAEGLKAMGDGRVLFGAVNLIPASAGLVAMIPGVVGAKLIELINGAKLQAGLTGLAAGLQSMNGTFVGSLALAAAGVGFAAFTVGAIGLGAVALLGAAAGAGLTALGGGLTSFAIAMSAPTPLGPVGLVAPVALALLGAALIPFAFALKIAAPAFVAFGTAMKLAFEGVASVITALFGGLSQFLSVLTLEKAAALIAMGGAFVVLGGGLAALGASALLGVAGLGVLGTLSLMGPGLATAATAVSTMAASVGELSRALKEITPESVENLKKIMEAGMEVSTGNAFANVSEPIMKLVGVLGGGSDSGENNQGQLLAKLDELIRVVKQGGNVYMDGQRVGQSLVLGASKLS